MSLKQTRHSLYLPFTENIRNIRSVGAVQHACRKKAGLLQRHLYKEPNAQTLTHTPKKTDETHTQHIRHMSQLKHFWWRLSEFSVNMHAFVT